MYIFRENTEDIYAGIEWQQRDAQARKFLKFLTEEMGVTKVRFPRNFLLRREPVSGRRYGTSRSRCHRICFGQPLAQCHVGA